MPNQTCSTTCCGDHILNKGATESILNSYELRTSVYTEILVLPMGLPMCSNVVCDSPSHKVRHRVLVPVVFMQPDSQR